MSLLSVDVVLAGKGVLLPCCSSGEWGPGRRARKRALRIIELCGLEATLKITQFQPPAMGRDTFFQTRLLKAPSLGMTKGEVLPRVLIRGF